jgi:hypothetical protein
MEDLQNQVNELFAEKLKIYQGGDNLSLPHIPRISKKYFSTKTIVIGQETNTWFRKGNDDLKNIFIENLDKISNICLENSYDKFIALDAANYKGMFWKFSRLLYEENIIKGNMIENGMLSHVWVNMFVIESCKDKKDKNGRPTKNSSLQKKVIGLQQDILYHIIKKLKPRRIIALTGHSLDNILCSHILKSRNVDFKQIDNNNIIDKWKLAQIIIKDKTHPLYDCNIIRSYHPSYFLGYMNANKKIATKIKEIGLLQSPSEYYTNLMLNKLKSTNF